MTVPIIEPTINFFTSLGVWGSVQLYFWLTLLQLVFGFNKKIISWIGRLIKKTSEESKTNTQREFKNSKRILETKKSPFLETPSDTYLDLGKRRK